ncbi:unnamed protein product [Withania somnifera]
MLKPSIPTPNHLCTLNLSLFDQPDPHNYTQVLFHYLPSINADLAELGFQIELLDDLLPWRIVVPLESKDLFPLLGIQVNLFNCGGLVFGIQISHIIADSFRIATFIKEWARVSRTGMTTKDCLPSFGHLPSLFPATVVPLEHHQFSPPTSSDIVSPKIVTRRFLFDALTIAKLKDRINSTSPLTKPTRVMTIMSLIWKVLGEINAAKHGHTRDSYFVIPINARGKSKIPSLENALGNGCIAGIASLEANHRQELHDIVNLIGSTPRDASLGIAKASIDDITSMLTRWTFYLCSRWCRFPWYEADFGWGKPFWVSSASRSGEVIFLMDTKDGDGTEAWVSLKENDIVEFERNIPDILSSFCFE